MLLKKKIFSLFLVNCTTLNESKNAWKFINDRENTIKFSKLSCCNFYTGLLNLKLMFLVTDVCVYIINISQKQM